MIYVKLDCLVHIFDIERFKFRNEILNLNANFNNLSDTLSIDGLQFLLISQFINKNNFKVALGGFGADEIFNSYPTYKYLRFFNKKRSLRLQK